MISSIQNVDRLDKEVGKKGREIFPGRRIVKDKLLRRMFLEKISLVVRSAEGTIPESASWDKVHVTFVGSLDTTPENAIKSSCRKEGKIL